MFSLVEKDPLLTLRIGVTRPKDAGAKVPGCHGHKTWLCLDPWRERWISNLTRKWNSILSWKLYEGCHLHFYRLYLFWTFNANDLNSIYLHEFQKNRWIFCFWIFTFAFPLLYLNTCIWGGCFWHTCFRKDGTKINLNKWQWSNRRMFPTTFWEQNVPNPMKNLPLPLAGHCGVDIRNKKK